VVLEELDDRPIALRKGKRTCTQHPIQDFIAYDNLSPTHRALVSSLDAIQIPRSIQEALKIPEWKKAVEEEATALKKNGTWVISKLPTRKKVVSCKWIFTIKYNSDGSINRYK
ncbi:hypothetical protein KN825_16495, partial [Weizmannia coagulans]